MDVLAHDYPSLKELLDFLLLSVGLLQHVLQFRLVVLLQFVVFTVLDALQGLEEELLESLEALLFGEGNASAIDDLLVPEVYPILGNGIHSLLWSDWLLLGQYVHGLGVPLVLGTINFLLFFILQHEPRRFFEGGRLFLNKRDDALEERSRAFGALEELLFGL